MTEGCFFFIGGEGEARTFKSGASASDSVRLQIHDLGCTFPPAGLTGELTVITYDSTYERYHRSIRSGTTLAREGSVGIDGALGLFSSAVRRTLPIVLTHDRSSRQP
jgi:hypothetical protein